MFCPIPLRSVNYHPAATRKAKIIDFTAGQERQPSARFECYSTVRLDRSIEYSASVNDYFDMIDHGLISIDKNDQDDRSIDRDEAPPVAVLLPKKHKFRRQVCIISNVSIHQTGSPLVQRTGGSPSSRSRSNIEPQVKLCQNNTKPPFVQYAVGTLPDINVKPTIGLPFPIRPYKTQEGREVREDEKAVTTSSASGRRGPSGPFPTSLPPVSAISVQRKGQGTVRTR